MVSYPRRPWASLALAVGLTSACNAIVGIQEAERDPLTEEPRPNDPGMSAPAADEPDAKEGGTSEAGPNEGGHEDSGQGSDAPVHDAEAESLCDVYCRTVMENCTEAAAVYPTLELCLAECAILPEGSPGDEIGNTIQCRLQNAELAKTTGELTVHCPVAGPTGNGVCGSDCEAYCMIFESACGTTFEEAFLGLPDCVDRCGAIPNANTYDVSFTSGNTLQCRFYHAGAATADASRHCPHAGGGAPCVD